VSSKPVLVAVLAAHLGACATTHEMARSEMAAVGRVARGAADEATVFDRDGQGVEIEPETEMVLHLAADGRRRDVTVRAEQLRIAPQGLWLPDGLYLPAWTVTGFSTVDPHRGAKTALWVTLAAVAVGATLAFYAIADGMRPVSAAEPGDN
jgi:hypothetical protein